VTTDYLHLVLTAAYQTLRALSEDSGSTKGALTCEDIKHFKIAVPSITEQILITDHIYNETKALEVIISRTEREIDLLREYRTRLTADVVTGKLDVREAAARLPEPEEEIETSAMAEDEEETIDDAMEVL
jgi:type I restriction enzyme S subunit